MKVILLENLRKIGLIGEIIDVKRGFARNYLISNKKALYASKENIAEVEKIKSELDEIDLIFFDKIFRSHPKAVKYQELMDMLDNTLAYETKIKKIAAAKIRIDTVLYKYCKSNDSVLQSKKNIHDSRIKEMFLKID